MLSLNARIESARQENSPFRVISEEMTSISNKTKELNLSATILINNALESTNSILQVMESVNTCLMNQGMEINNTVKSFKEINESINSVNPCIQNLASAQQEVLAGLEEISDNE
jgi:methyl-accepting chemotaxis protein